MMKVQFRAILLVATLAAAPAAHSADREAAMSQGSEEKSESGSPIYRHEPRESDWTPPEHSAAHLEEIDAHVEKHIGKVESVYHEIASDIVHLDVMVVPATPERPYHVLVTSGVSDEPMQVPEGMEKFRRVELLMALPKEWPLDEASFQDEANYWPVRWLKMVGRLPHTYETWIGWGHTIPNGDPPEPIANTGFVGVMLAPPYELSQDFFQLQAKSGETITFYALTPLYQEEMDLKLRKGAEDLEERFEKQGIGLVLDVDRPNVAKAKRWFGW